MSLRLLIVVAHRGPSVLLGIPSSQSKSATPASIPARSNMGRVPLDGGKHERMGQRETKGVERLTQRRCAVPRVQSLISSSAIRISPKALRINAFHFSNRHKRQGRRRRTISPGSGCSPGSLKSPYDFFNRHLAIRIGRKPFVFNATSKFNRRKQRAWQQPDPPES